MKGMNVKMCPVLTMSGLNTIKLLFLTAGHNSVLVFLHRFDENVLSPWIILIAYSVLALQLRNEKGAVWL
jgi:hypothetical protein